MKNKPGLIEALHFLIRGNDRMAVASDPAGGMMCMWWAFATGPV